MISDMITALLIKDLIWLVVPLVLYGIYVVILQICDWIGSKRKNAKED
jgi:uncharacterized membrane protein YbhN (UPF0104 family)